MGGVRYRGEGGLEDGDAHDRAPPRRGVVTRVASCIAPCARHEGPVRLADTMPAVIAAYAAPGGVGRRAPYVAH